MKDADFRALGASDPRLAAHADGVLPAWLWSADGTRILWANPAGVDAFGARGDAQLTETIFGPADPHRRQIAQLARHLNPDGTVRMERLRGFGAAPGGLATCSCSRIDFPDGRHGVLVVSAVRVARRKRPHETIAAAAPEITSEPAGRPPTPARMADYETPAQSNEAPAEFALFDEFAEGREPPPAEQPPAAAEDLQPATASEPSPADDDADEDLPIGDRRYPLRFKWRTDRDGRFNIGTDEFLKLIGPLTESLVGRPWREIAAALGLDGDARMRKALGSHEAFSGISLHWPVDGGYLPVELSGAPALDSEQRFDGYRGFGICRDLAGLLRLELLRRHGISVSPSNPQPPSSGNVEPEAVADSAPAEEIAEAVVLENLPSTDLDHPVDTQEPLMSTELPREALTEVSANVLPFRPVGDAKPPILTPVENSAFDELARQLSARLDNGEAGEAGAPAEAEAAEIVVEPEAAIAPPAASDRPDWLAPPEPPARGLARRDKALLDLLPAGVLIYRLDRLLYANPAFLRRIGYSSLHALEDAGGLDALYVEPGVSVSSSTSEAGTPVTISASHAGGEESEPATTAARLHTISWDDEAALALICSEGPVDAAPVPAPAIAPEPVQQALPTAAGEADAEELGAILDTTAEGIVMFDEEGNVTACNRSAEALFGYDGEEFVQRNLADLFAPESQHGVFEYFAGVKSAGSASLLDHGRETLGRVRQGGFIPLSITIGRTRADGPNFFAVFRDLSQSRKSESQLQQAQRLSERAANAKSDMLARISHELRAPLNAIIGFAEVMIGERFGSLGNERYLEYMKDIRASGQRVISVIDDLLDLTRIETGKIDLSFASQNLNELVENCVAVMQPQANRERIIIRTSLAHTLPPVVADARALRQIAMNLIGTSIHLAKAGGQVIVSTALSDFGDVVLRVRDTGQAMNDNEVAAALEPFRARGPSDQAADASAVSLSLTKALVEANRAQFHIRPGPHTGTLVEVVFSRTVARV
ncbi:PAS domain-containing protein [Bradyrhizobium sp.]|uniref:PAS domain-containing sensor histidine kinase n=1 Tax=Bradyrhizobium sp. TaxID=376 RepID=UPI001DBB3EC7|nr:PAS domain-containing protein [Bradyrhizobium sp.]MBI5320892.1 PAS domain S-box protein [Bradyrhizobium sp.]